MNSKIFSIEIEETSSKTVEVEANSVEEAISKLKKLYQYEEIILSSENHVMTKFKELD
jgi:flagellar biosynthesis regulator FlbT